MHQDQPVLSVSQFIEHLNVTIATNIYPGGVAIEGEVAEYRVSQDRWVWFLLKDKDGVLPCFATVWQVRQPLEDGMKVRIFGMPKIHVKSGKFSVVVERVEAVGEGSLKRAYELLKKNLTAQGIFATERKRPLPRFPENIYLVASRESAAYTDFLRILGSRWGGVNIHLLHVQVQGQNAVQDITGAFRYINAHATQGELVVLTRGGGSIEDLHAFNSEEVVRAIFSCALPVVVGVGHERDETLADYVADVRASTPTNAAERIVPDREAESRHLDSLVSSIARTLSNQTRQDIMRLNNAFNTMHARISRNLSNATHKVLSFRTAAQLFLQKIDIADHAIKLFAERASSAMLRASTIAASRVTSAERLLASLDPRAILKRGYAIVWSGKKVLKSTANIDIGTSIQVQFGEGTASARIDRIDGKEYQRQLL
jgi:exodeoxyribonuclease VII large subunit